MHNPLSFWRQQLRGVLQPELPTDQRRDPRTGYMAASLPLVIPPDLAASIERLSQTESVPPAVILMATLQSFLSRVTQENDICVGFHLACPESASVVPVRCNVGASLSFRDLLPRVHKTITEACRYRRIPRGDLAALLHVDSGPRQTSLFAVTLAYEIDAVSVAGTDLSVSLYETSHGLAGTWTCNAALFEEATAVRMKARFLTLLEAAIAEPDQSPLRLPLLAAAQHHPSTRLGICLERSLETVLGLLATLQTGDASLPLDPA